jgi:hypothetical protein
MKTVRNGTSGGAAKRELLPPQRQRSHMKSASTSPRLPQKLPDRLSIKLLGFRADARGVFSIAATVLIFFVLIWAGYFSLKPLYIVLGLG